MVRLLAAAAVLLTAGASAAQDYRFSVPEMECTVEINQTLTEFVTAAAE